MGDAREVLVLFTATYPFGRKSETFLDDEIPILSRHFAQIIVMPSLREATTRTLPEGVLCDTSLADALLDGGDREILKSTILTARQFGLALRNERRPRAYLRHPRTYLRLLAQNRVKYRVLRSLIEKRGLQDALFYDYWLENTTLALSWLRNEGRVKRAVARAHGFDVYDDRWEAGAVPFRAFKVAALDRVFTISAHGLRYLSEAHPDYRGKLVLSRLGVASSLSAGWRATSIQSNEPPLVVSCASLLPFKRVDLIPAVLAAIGRPLSWTHFGDGPARPEVEQAARQLPPHVQWHLAGHVDHAKVFEYYRAHRVRLFISLSASEGLPVSMMEAISFGIPLLGTSVGGVPEIVNASTGRLMGVDDPVHVVAEAGRRLLDGEGPLPATVREFFEANFDATTNFGEFAQMLHAV